MREREREKRKRKRKRKRERENLLYIMLRQWFDRDMSNLVIKRWGWSGFMGGRLNVFSHFIMQGLHQPHKVCRACNCKPSGMQTWIALPLILVRAYQAAESTAAAQPKVLEPALAPTTLPAAAAVAAATEESSLLWAPSISTAATDRGPGWQATGSVKQQLQAASPSKLSSPKLITLFIQKTSSSLPWATAASSYETPECIFLVAPSQDLKGRICSSLESCACLPSTHTAPISSRSVTSALVQHCSRWMRAASLTSETEGC